MSEPRQCFYIPADAHVDGKGFVPSLVTEGEPGHAPLVGSGAFAQPYYWGDTYDKAKATAETENTKLGLTPDDVAEIIISSMRAVRMYVKDGYPDITVEPEGTVTQGDARFAQFTTFAEACTYFEDLGWTRANTKEESK